MQEEPLHAEHMTGCYQATGAGSKVPELQGYYLLALDQA